MPYAVRPPWIAGSLCAVLLALGLGTRLAALDDTNAASPEVAPICRESTPFHAVIPVSNPYDRAVRVKLLDASCTCAKLELKDYFLLPHGRTTLDIAVDNQNRSGPQDIGVSVFVSDPDFEPIEVTALWTVRAAVQVDSLPPSQEDTQQRPDDKGWQDIYRFVVEERPDEPQRLRKNIRLSCPPGEVPPGGLKILSIEYPGRLWAFTPVAQADGSWLIRARANPATPVMPEGEYHEKVLVHTNHPDKPLIALQFDSKIGMPQAAPSDPTHP